MTKKFVYLPSSADDVPASALIVIRSASEVASLEVIARDQEKFKFMAVWASLVLQNLRFWKTSILDVSYV